MNKEVINLIITPSFLNAISPYFRRKIVNNYGIENYNLINSWIICILHTYSSNNLNLQIHNLKLINFKDIIILIGLSQIQIYSSTRYNSLMTYINVSEVLFYIRFLESFWNFIFSILLENNYNKNKLLGLIIISSGLVVYNK
tara:strand:+ start:1987 stop:2412 length:426 start_codon:yes stop_codon:yes gene_type:complete